MSRLYMIEVHVKASKEEHLNIVKALEHWGMSLTPPHGEEPFSSYEKGYLMYEGEIILAGGQEENESHLELKEVLPNFPLTTKWNCVEYREWDEVIRDEEEGE